MRAGCLGFGGRAGWRHGSAYEWSSRACARRVNRPRGAQVINLLKPPCLPYKLPFVGKRLFRNLASKLRKLGSQKRFQRNVFNKKRKTTHFQRNVFNERLPNEAFSDGPQRGLDDSFKDFDKHEKVLKSLAFSARRDISYHALLRRSDYWLAGLLQGNEAFLYLVSDFRGVG